LVFILGIAENKLDNNLFILRTNFARISCKMRDAKPIIVLWCALGLLLAVVVVVRVIHKRGEPPLSSMKVISDTNGLVTGITVSNQPVATFTYGYDTGKPKVADTNTAAYRYDASGQRIAGTNSQR
jgi:hypothetical protein